MDKRKTNRIITEVFVGVIAVIIAFVFVQNTPAYKKYYRDITRNQSKVDRALNKFENALLKGNKVTILSTYNDLSLQCYASISRLKIIGTFKGDAELYRKSLEMLEFYQEAVKNEFKEILQIFAASGYKITPENKDRIREIGESLTKKEKKLTHAFNAASLVFRKQYNIPMVIVDINDIGLLLLIYFFFWLYPVKILGKILEASRNGFFVCGGAAAVSIGIGQVVSLILGKGDFMIFDFTVIIKILLSTLVFQLFMGVNFGKGLGISAVFWVFVFLSTRYIYIVLFG